MIDKIDHIAIAVKSLDESIPYYENVLGLKCEGKETVAEQKVTTAFFTVGGVHIELLEATCPESPVAKFLEKNPAGGLHHIAFFTKDIMSQLNICKDNGIKLLNEEPKIGAHSKKIAFAHPKSTQGVLTEFCSQDDVDQQTCCGGNRKGKGRCCCQD